MESERTNTNMNNNNDTVRSNFFVAVHVGAGYHSPLRSSNYMKAMKEACLAASKVLGMQIEFPFSKIRTSK